VSERKDRVRLQIGGQEFNVVGGSFQAMLAAINQINGRRFVSELKVWQVPGPVEEVQRQLEISGYSLEGGAPVSSTPTPPAASTGAGGDRIRVLVGGQRLAVVGGSFQDMLAVVKGLPGRRFDGETKLWEISGDPDVIRGMIGAAGFQLEGAAKIPTGSVPPMELPDFGGQAPSPYEEPDFFADDDAPEPPPWWDDEQAPPPVPMEDSYFEEPGFDFRSPPGGVKPAPALPMADSASRRSGDRIRLRLGEMVLVVSGGEFQAMLAMIKSIPGRRFNGEERIWEIPETLGLESLAQRVAAAGFMVEQE
jgi:hypothetical protein